ncbi:sirohydrochlorin chelatase [Pseudomonadota bacterium]
MKALLLVAHGSNNQNSNNEICQLLQAFRSTCHGFEMVEYAFLELGEPNIGTAVMHIIRLGADEIIVLPYFLAKGNHITRDIAKIVSELQDIYPGTSIEILPHIGASTKMLDLLLEHVNANTH